MSNQRVCVGGGEFKFLQNKFSDQSHQGGHILKYYQEVSRSTKDTKEIVLQV